MKKILGFSLAEALITLLIVCLITLASVPILTKKKRDLSKMSHGSFKCVSVLESYSVNNNPNNPAYTTQWAYYQQNNKDAWVKSSDSRGCLFYPEQKAQKFVVTAIGGGGGGGGGYVSSIDKSFHTSDTLKLTVSGMYFVHLIGGGGGGGGHGSSNKCGGSSGGGGQSGSEHKGYVNLEAGSYTVNIGGGADHSHDDAKWADDGGTTFIGSPDTVFAQGGEGGRGRNWATGGCYGGETANISEVKSSAFVSSEEYTYGRRANGDVGGFGFGVGSTMKGSGGAGGKSDWGGSPGWGFPRANGDARITPNGFGLDGFARVSGSSTMIGEGGSAGKYNTIVYDKIKTNFLILQPGKGGNAAMPYACSANIGNRIVLSGSTKICYPHGENGATTFVQGSPVLTAPGGDGAAGFVNGKTETQSGRNGAAGPLADNDMQKAEYTPASNTGDAPLYHATTNINYAGAGGSGGGAPLPTTFDNSSRYYNGGFGAGGAVLVEW